MFSVIIPNFNREKTIIKAIESVLNQTYVDFELIIVDDCSTDNSLKEISKLNDPRIKVFELKKNSGAAVARNFGIKKSNGDFISFLDSDDYLEKDFLEITNQILSPSDTTVGFMWTGVRYHLKNEIIEESWEPVKMHNSYLTFLNDLHIGTGSGITVKREVFDECGLFNENLPAAEDTEFFLRITKNFNYLFTNEILMNVNKIGNDRMSKNLSKVGIAYNIFIVDHLTEIDKDKILQKKYYYKMMWLNYHLADKKKARSFYFKIPKELRTIKIKALKILYDLIPLKYSSYLHRKLAS
jgi:glycosyltransferase involved in cell wall biosynthesis